jgi:hypothetical protein
MKPVLAGFGLSIAVASGAAAQELPSLLCASNVVMECTRVTGCLEVPAAAVDLPPFVRVDLANEAVTDPRQPDQVRSVIEAIDAVDGKLILHGTDPGAPDVRDGVGWTATISEQTGEMVASAPGEGVAYLIFGSCMVE